MPQKDYKAYCETARGKAARARSKANYIAKRKAMCRSYKADWQFNPLIDALKHWITTRLNP